MGKEKKMGNNDEEERQEKKEKEKQKKTDVAKERKGRKRCPLNSRKIFVDRHCTFLLHANFLNLQ